MYRCSNNEKRNASRILVGNPEGNRQLQRPRRTWVDHINTDLMAIRWGGINWIDLDQYADHWKALVNTVINLRGL
jgi:hypothetical protein